MNLQVIDNSMICETEHRVGISKLSVQKSVTYTSVTGFYISSTSRIKKISYLGSRRIYEEDVLRDLAPKGKKFCE